MQKPLQLAMKAIDVLNIIDTFLRLASFQLHQTTPLAFVNLT